jgi:hypothetical protein
VLERQVIWLPPDATSFAAPCEACRDDRDWQSLFSPTVVEGSLRAEADVGFFSCRRGHRIRVRRIARTFAHEARAAAR